MTIHYDRLGPSATYDNLTGWEIDTSGPGGVPIPVWVPDPVSAPAPAPPPAGPPSALRGDPGSIDLSIFNTPVFVTTSAELRRQAGAQFALEAAVAANDPWRAMKVGAYHAAGQNLLDQANAQDAATLAKTPRPAYVAPVAKASGGPSTTTIALALGGLAAAAGAFVFLRKKR